MGLQMPTHFDSFVLITVMSCFGFGVLAFVAWLAWDAHTSAKRSFEEGRRMTRAVAGLVVQESEKIRELMR